MQQRVDSVEKIAKKNFFFREMREWMNNAVNKRAIPIKYHRIRYTIIESFYTYSHTRANITTMHNLFSITSTLRIELNWIQFKRLFCYLFFFVFYLMWFCKLEKNGATTAQFEKRKKKKLNQQQCYTLWATIFALCWTTQYTCNSHIASKNISAVWLVIACDVHAAPP